MVMISLLFLSFVSKKHYLPTLKPFHPAAVQVAGPPTAAGYQQQHPHASSSSNYCKQVQQQHQTYQQHQMHPATAALYQQLHHPAAAAAMFTPLSLRTFISPTPNHMNLGQALNVASLVTAQHQQQHQPMPPTQQTQANSRHHQGSPIQAAAHHSSQATNNNHHIMQTHGNQSQLNAIVPLRQPSMIPVQKVRNQTNK